MLPYTVKQSIVEPLSFMLLHFDDPVAYFFHEVDAVYCAKVLNADEVKRRRGWWAEKVDKGWVVRGGVMSGLVDFFTLFPQVYDDPSDVLLAADKWYSEELERTVFAKSRGRSLT